MNQRELRKVVKGFRAGILQGRASQSMCYVVCYPLQGYLQACGVHTTLADGHIKLKRKIMHHCWLRLDDGTIVDPTADQFNEFGFNLPALYIGAQPEHYAESYPSPQREKRKGQR